MLVKPIEDGLDKDVVVPDHFVDFVGYPLFHQGHFDFALVDWLIEFWGELGRLEELLVHGERHGRDAGGPVAID